ncbi:MAG: xanthine dehydrogenase family protein subunit M [Gammaproteobacteria bacterium]|nr:xanthine dehydrogenase family protein subunit M [Gammaproteobacteria bacterium]
MYPFEYSRAGSIDEAIDLKRADESAQWLAGGMTLLPSMKLRLAAPGRLIDLTDITALNEWTIGDDRIVLGSLSSHRRVAESDDVGNKVPALSTVAAGIGDPQVRNRGTLGGSIANNDPAADYPAALTGLGATIRTSQREISADDFFRDFFETTLGDDELVVAVSFPVPRRAAYLKFRTPGSRYALVGVMVAETATGVRVAVTGAGPGVFREASLEAALSEDFRPEALAGIDVSAEGLNADMHASPEYRAHLIGILARRAAAQAVASAG